MQYKCITFEGLDQVGKGDAVKNLSLQILNSGYTTCVISFPYYATPLGFSIRKILVNGITDSIKISKSREVELKMVLFALNRLEILSCILSNTEKYDVFVFDRGPFSCVLTIAYHVSENSTELKNIEFFVEKGLEFDLYFRDTLNIDNCVIYIKHKDIEWERSRGNEKEDLHESDGVQKISADIYNICANKIPTGWHEVVTKDRDGWRERDNIKQECFDIGVKCNVLDRKDSKRNGVLTYLGIEEIQEFLYKGSLVDDKLKREWMVAIQSNDKKEVYRVSELISSMLADSTELLSWNDKGIARYVKLLIDKYPEVLDILSSSYGKTFVGKFKKSLE